MSLFGQAKPLGSGGLFGQSQIAQQTQPAQQTGSVFGQTMGGQQASTMGNPMMGQQQQVQQMPTLAQSQAQLSSSLWQPGKETPRMHATMTKSSQFRKSS
jgi:nuclear pore complex protein Nup54